MSRKDQHTEYGGAPGDNRRLPNKQQRPLNVKERARLARVAGIRDEPLPPTSGQQVARRIG